MVIKGNLPQDSPTFQVSELLSGWGVGTCFLFSIIYIYIYIWDDPDVILPIDELHHFSRWLLHHQPDPICSMYGICTYIYPKNCPNVGKYSSTTEHMGIIFCPDGFIWFPTRGTSYLWVHLDRPVYGYHSPIDQWPFQEPIDWRYLPYIRPIFQGYVRGYTRNSYGLIWY